MKRASVVLPLTAMLVLLPASAFADDFTDPGFSDPGFDDSGMGIPGWFIALFVLAAVGAVVMFFYRMSVVRDIARKGGLDEGEATRMAFLDDQGVSTAYLASHLRPQPAAPASAAPERSTSDRLRELDRLRSEGLVTEAEYAERRAAILGSL